MEARTDTVVTDPVIDALVARAIVEPVSVLAEVELWRARGGLSAADSSRLHRAAALAERALDRWADASRSARRAVTSARRAGAGPREAEARLTLSLCLFEAGRTGAALAEIDRAAELADETLALQIAGQRGIMLSRLGRFDEAVTAHTRTLGAARDVLDRLRATNNRAVALAFLGRFAAARADLDDALLMAEAAGASAIAARIVHNMGFVHALAGELPEALARFDEADSAFVALGLTLGQNHVARARALLMARRHDDAHDALVRAVGDLEHDGRSAEAVDALVLLAQVELAAGRPREARVTAERAARAAGRQQRPLVATIASSAALASRLAVGRSSRATWDAALVGADRLAAMGLASDADELRLSVAEVARARGEQPMASMLLATVARSRSRGTDVDRARGWYAEALSRVDRGEERSALRAATRGLEVVRHLQGTSGAAELRASLAGHGEALAQVGLELLLRRADAPGVLRWLSLWRGAGAADAADRSRRVEPELAGELASLRAARIRLDRAVAEGDDPVGARRAVVELERSVRARSLRRAGTGSADRRGRTVAVPAGSTLVAFVVLGDEVAAVVAGRGPARLVRRVASRAEVAALVDEACFGLRRLSRPGGSAAARSAAAVATAATLASFDRLLVAPLELPPTGELRLSIPPPLAVVPWSGLSSLRARSFVVSPWIARDRSTAIPDARGVVLAAGPRLPGALSELHHVAAVHPHAVVLHPSEARVEAVLAAMDGAAVAHLACHGRARSDSPMFSELDLTDGPLTVYDVERLRRAPRTVVLAACDVGTASSAGGEELVGWATGLLVAGTREVLASLAPVPDEAVVPFMVAVHRSLAEGASLAVAAARARRELDTGDPVSLAVGAAFTCFG